MEGVSGVGIGAGCCSPWNTAREAKMREVEENPPLRMHYLANLIEACGAYAEVSILPWYKFNDRRDGLRLKAHPFCPYDVDLTLYARDLPPTSRVFNEALTYEGLPFTSNAGVGTFTAHYVCEDMKGPLFHGTSGMSLAFQGRGFGILAYLGLMEIIALFAGWMAPESRYGGTTSEEAWRSWLLLQNLDETFYRVVDDCDNYDPYFDDTYELDAPARVWQYHGPHLLGSLIPTQVVRHPAIEKEGIATGHKALAKFNTVLRRWVEKR